MNNAAEQEKNHPEPDAKRLPTHEWSRDYCARCTTEQQGKVMNDSVEESLDYSLEHKESITGGRFRSRASSDENGATAWLDL